MLMHNSQSGNHPTNGELLETIIGRLMVEIARGESLVRQRSMLLSIADNRQSLADRRGRLEEETARYLARLLNLAQDHGLDPLRDVHGVDLRLVWLATRPLERKQSPAREAAKRHPLDTFNDDRLRDALWALTEALHKWRYHDGSPEEQGALVLDRLAKATAALEQREEVLS